MFLTDGNAWRFFRLHTLYTDVTYGNVDAAMQHKVLTLKPLFYLTISSLSPQNSALCDRYRRGNTTWCLFTSGIDHLASLDNDRSHRK